MKIWFIFHMASNCTKKYWNELSAWTSVFVPDLICQGTKPSIYGTQSTSTIYYFLPSTFHVFQVTDRVWAHECVCDMSCKKSTLFSIPRAPNKCVCRELQKSELKRLSFCRKAPSDCMFPYTSIQLSNQSVQKCTWLKGKKQQKSSCVQIAMSTVKINIRLFWKTIGKLFALCS